MTAQPTPTSTSSTGSIDSTSTSSRLEIKDLCSTLCSLSPHSECLGFLLDNLQKHHELHTIKDNSENSTQKWDLVSLETLLTSRNEARLSRYQRYKLASILASSVLQLQTTPWLIETLSKKNIFFYRHEHEVLIEDPYICSSFSSRKNSPRRTPLNTSQEPKNQMPKSRFATRNSISQLGILLLELCFSSSISDAPMRNLYLSNGQEHAGTDYMTALDWAEMVGEEEPGLEGVIKSCVFCVFEEKADWESRKFVQAVYKSVVEPLDGVVGKWAAIQ
jgi:hypothetical protein